MNAVQQDSNIVPPTQHTDISSSLTLQGSGHEFINLCNDDSEEEDMPWLESFDKAVRKAVGGNSYCILRHLLATYLGLDPQIRVEDHNPYLDKMSEIIGVYVEMELRASKILDPESCSQIAAKILAVLYIYLDNSEEHMVRVLLKSKVLSKTYSKIYQSIFKKFCCNIVRSSHVISDVSYARYLLLLKLWKKTCDNKGERKRIDDLAVQILGPQGPKRSADTSKHLLFLRQRGGTVRLMKRNSFDLRAACEDFVTYEERTNGANSGVDKTGYS